MRITTTILFVFVLAFTHAQKATPTLEILSSSNDERVLYRGFKNYVEIRVGKGDSTDYYILGSNCYVTQMESNGEKLPFNQYIIKPGKGEYSNINIIETDDGVSKKLSKETFEIKNLPDPAIYLDTYADGDAISRDVELIQVSCPKETGLKLDVKITDWTMMIDDKIYNGSNHIITQEVWDLLQTVPSGTKIEMTLICKGTDNVNRKFAAEFSVK
jgi:hypothetical protein